MTDHDDDRFEALLRDAAVTYNRPPDERQMPLDAMWKAVEAQAFPPRREWRAVRVARDIGGRAVRLTRQTHWRVAAALILGVAIGRLPLWPTTRAASPPPVPPTVVTDPAPQPFDVATSRYLGQTAALLIALPGETNGGRPDEGFLRRANELLLTTRLLLDSPSASEHGLRNLLEDLELVLVQVVRLEHERDRARRTELELIQQALDQRDVLPRLRTAVSEHGADD